MKTEMAFDWESQARQYSRNAAPGLRYERNTNPRTSPPNAPIDCLLFYDRAGVLCGILNHFPTTLSLDLGNGWIATEQAGNVNMWVDPTCQRRGIGTKLLAEAVRRWNVNLNRQDYTPAGAALVNAFQTKGGR